MQEKLGKSLGKSVRSKKSASSLELTLGDEGVNKGIQEYVEAMERVKKARVKSKIHMEFSRLKLDQSLTYQFRYLQLVFIWMDLFQ